MSKLRRKIQMLQINRTILTNDAMDRELAEIMQMVIELEDKGKHLVQPVSDLINDLGDTKRRYILWHDGGEWIISLEGKEMEHCKTLAGWLTGNDI